MRGQALPPRNRLPVKRRRLPATKPVARAAAHGSVLASASATKRKLRGRNTIPTVMKANRPVELTHMYDDCAVVPADMSEMVRRLPPNGIAAIPKSAPSRTRSTGSYDRSRPPKAEATPANPARPKASSAIRENVS